MDGRTKGAGRLMSDSFLDALSPDEVLDVVCPRWPDESVLEVQRQVLLNAFPIRALAQWRAERAAGVDARGPLLFAACLEAAGIEARNAGCPLMAGEYFMRAAAVITDAVVDHAGRAA